MEATKYKRLTGGEDCESDVDDSWESDSGVIGEQLDVV